jgi:hypothetical protein
MEKTPSIFLLVTYFSKAPIHQTIYFSYLLLLFNLNIFFSVFFFFNLLLKGEEMVKMKKYFVFIFVDLVSIVGDY